MARKVSLGRLAQSLVEMQAEVLLVGFLAGFLVGLVGTADQWEMISTWRQNKCFNESLYYLYLASIRQQRIPDYHIFGDELDITSPNYFYRRNVSRYIPPPKRRVYHATDVDILNDYPFNAICAVLMSEADKQPWKQCSCVLVDKNYALSAKFCFRTRNLAMNPHDNIPESLRVSFGGSLFISSHRKKVRVDGIFLHPDGEVDAVLLKLHHPLELDDVYLEPSAWMFTTGYKSMIPPCRTMACSYGMLSETEWSDKLHCVYYVFTTNPMTINATKLWQNASYVRASRYYLASVREHVDKFQDWVNDDWATDDPYGGTCVGDHGGPLFYADRNMTNALFMIGMISNNRMFDRCGRLNVDYSVSMIGIVGWLSKYITDVRDPLSPNLHRGYIY